MTYHEVTPDIMSDSKLQTKAIRHIDIGQILRDRAYIAICPFACPYSIFNSHERLKTALIRIMIRILVWVFILAFMDTYNFLNIPEDIILNISIVVVVLIYVIKAGIYFIISKRLKTSGMEILHNLEEKYTKIRDDYVQIILEKNNIQSNESGLVYYDSNELVLNVNSVGDSWAKGELKNNYGLVDIYDDKRSNKEENESKSKVKKEKVKIASVEFEKNYSMYASDPVKALNYLSPMMIVEYNSHYSDFNRVSRGIAEIFGNAISIQLKNTVNIAYIYKNLNLYDMRIEEYFIYVDVFIKEFNALKTDVSKLSFVLGGKS